MRSLLVATFVLTASFTLAAADPALPPSVTLPIKASSEVTVENFGHAQFKVPEGDDGKDTVVEGKHWSTRLDISGMSGDERAKWATLVAALKKSGWTIVLGKQEWNPPYASMKLVKGGKETWLAFWVGDDLSLEVVEKGTPTVKLALTAPTDGIAKVGEKADFPFLKKFPGAKLVSTEHDDSPFLVTLEEGKDQVVVATGATIKKY